MFPISLPILLKNLTKQAPRWSSVRSLNKVTPGVVTRLTELIGNENVTTNNSIREHHGRDESHYHGMLPDAVVFPQSTEDVSKIVRFCDAEEIPVIPFGSGSGMAGGIIPIQGGLTMDLTKMDQVTTLNQDDFDVTVQPGVTRKAINNYLRHHGLWFPVDPGADASLCGMCATSASGTNAVKYGTMRTNVLNLEVVLADGTIIHTAGKNRRSKKSSAGYNLTNLFVGSEGTLGVITKATLKLYGIPEKMVSAICHFKSAEGAIDSTVQLLQSGVDIARIEFLDELSMRICSSYSKLDSMQNTPTLFLEFHGTEKSIAEQVEITDQIMSSNGGSAFRWASGQEERNKLWTARHNYFYAVLATSPNKKSYITDVAVPITHLAEAIAKTTKICEDYGFQGPIAGHVGDGNFHMTIMFDPGDKDEVERCRLATDAIARVALEHDGTCTGEHGIGLEKKHLLAEQLGEETCKVMRIIKRALDPKGILNPGKIF